MKVTAPTQEQYRKFFKYGPTRTWDNKVLSDVTMFNKDYNLIDLDHRPIGIRIVDRGQCKFYVNSDEEILDNEIYIKLALFTTVRAKTNADKVEFTYQVISCPVGIMQMIMMMEPFQTTTGSVYLSGILGYADVPQSQTHDLYVSQSVPPSGVDESRTKFTVRSNKDSGADLSAFMNNIQQEWCCFPKSDIIVLTCPPCKDYVIWSKYVQDFIALCSRHGLSACSLGHPTYMTEADREESESLTKAATDEMHQLYHTVVQV